MEKYSVVYSFPIGKLRLTEEAGALTQVAYQFQQSEPEVSQVRGVFFRKKKRISTASAVKWHRVSKKGVAGTAGDSLWRNQEL